MARKNSKEKILQCALTEFRQNGYNGSSCDAIAQMADVSKTLVFKYYDTKENILFLAMERICEDYISATNYLLCSHGLSLRECMDELFLYTKENRTSLSFILGTYMTPSLRETVAASEAILRKRFWEIFYKYETGYHGHDFFALLGLIGTVYLGFIASGDEELFTSNRDMLLRLYAG